MGTSRKWLAGPRGVGFLIIPALTATPPPATTMDAPAPTLGGHTWTLGTGTRGNGTLGNGTLGTGTFGPEPSSDGEGALWAELSSQVGEPVPVPGAARYESAESAVAARVGLGVAVLEHQALGPSDVHAHLARLGRTTRELLDGAGGWRVVEPYDEPSALVTLRPPPGDTAERAAARAAEASLLVGVVPTARAPLDLREPVLRVSPPPGTPVDTLHALARVLAS
ncbi:hypothetical protein ACFQYP_35270 [Nonomuraea antimicrobica]